MNFVGVSSARETDEWASIYRGWYHKLGRVKGKGRVRGGLRCTG